MKTIVIATDGSPSAADAVELGLELAAEHEALPVLVHVVPEFDALPSSFAPAAALRHEVSESDWEPLNDAEQTAHERGLEVAKKLLLGDPADELVAFADSVDADLLVIGSRGHGALMSAVLGSVSRRVLRETRRPVLIVRPARVRAEAVAA